MWYSSCCHWLIFSLGLKCNTGWVCIFLIWLRLSILMRLHLMIFLVYLFPQWFLVYIGAKIDVELHYIIVGVNIVVVENNILLNSHNYLLALPVFRNTLLRLLNDIINFFVYRTNYIRYQYCILAITDFTMGIYSGVDCLVNVDGLTDRYLRWGGTINMQ